MTERSGMICDICALCVRVFVLCVIYVYGPEGNYLMGRKAMLCGPKGPGRKAYVRKVYWGTH